MTDTQPDQSAPTRAVIAVVAANVALAFGPWFVRLADVGPVAAAFWRITLAAPILVAMATTSKASGSDVHRDAPDDDGEARAST